MPTCPSPSRITARRLSPIYRSRTNGRSEVAGDRTVRLPTPSPLQKQLESLNRLYHELMVIGQGNRRPQRERSDYRSDAQ